MKSRKSISRGPWFATLLAVALCVRMAGATAWTAIINGEGPDSETGIYDRFVVGTYPGAPVANPSFIGAALDLSGIGWLDTNPTRSITLVSPQYFVAASHYLTGIGSTFQFEGTDDLLHSATVASYHTLTYTGTAGAQSSDLTLGRFTTALPASVTPMPIFYQGATDISVPSSFDAYAGVSLFNYGRTARMGTNVLDDFSEFSFGSPVTNIGLFYTQGAGAGETLLEGGDSGSPTLAYQDGVYGLIGTHSGVVPALSLSADAFVAYTPYVNQINAVLALDNQSLTFVSTPEPGTMLVGLALLGICGMQWVRRVRQRRDFRAHDNA